MTDQETPKEPETGNESKEKLSQIRYNFTRSKTIIDELDEYYKQFEGIRTKLDDTSDGLTANSEWSTRKKDEIAQLAKDASAKLTELETAKTNAETLIQSIHGIYDDKFEPLFIKIVDPTTGLEAVHASATSYLEQIKVTLATTQADYATAATTLSDIESKSSKIKAAYDEFIKLKIKVDDPEDGIDAQYETIKQYAKDAAQAKNKAEAELASVISLKTTATENLGNIQDSKVKIDTLHQESQTLTEAIRNNLDVSTADTLSSAITEQRKQFSVSVIFWGISTGLVVVLLAAILGYIYYTLFVAEGDANILKKETDALMILVTVISKAIFTSPIIFALIFTTSHFSKAKALHDHYVGKEIAAKNLQAYTKLLEDQFPDAKDERLNFTLKNMQAIYDDPTLTKKKRRFNINIGKVVQFDVQDNDMEEFKSDILKSAKELEEKAKKESPLPH
jgi:hypothetical protein